MNLSCILENPVSSRFLCGFPISSGSENASFVENEDSTRSFGRVAFPILLFLSTVGNVLMLGILSREKKQRRANVAYLITLCSANVIVMWLELPAYLGVYYAGIREQPWYLESIKWTLGLVTWGQQTAILISHWVLLLFTMERLLSLIPPSTFRSRAQIVCTKLHLIPLNAVLPIIAGICSIPHLIFYYTWLNTSTDQGVSCAMTFSLISDWLENWSVIRPSLSAFHSQLILPLVTFFVLATANLTVAVLLILGRRRLKQGPENEQNNNISPRAKLSWIFKILSRSILLYFTTQLAENVFMIFVSLSNPPSCAVDIAPETSAFWFPVVHIVALVNYSANFFLYAGLVNYVKKLRPGKRVPREVTARNDPYELVPIKQPRKVSWLQPLQKTTLPLPTTNIPKKGSELSFFLPDSIGHILTVDQFLELRKFLPFRNRILRPVLIFTTDESGTSIRNFLSHVGYLDSSLMVVKTMNKEIFGAFCANSWDDRFRGKREYLFFGTGETFLFVFDADGELHLYPWVGLQGRKSSDSGLFMAADAKNLSIGGGGGTMAISFESDLSRGFSGPSVTFDNPPLCQNGTFETAILEIYGFSSDI